jgi:hypothetical protein
MAICRDNLRRLRRQAKRNTGAVLLVVLFIVMVVCVLSLGFLSQSHIQMACAKNMVLRTQMDYLADAALVHAKTLLLHPQDVSEATSPDGYWQGGTGFTIDPSPDNHDYYDIMITSPTNRCTYDIDCLAYRDNGGLKLGSSRLKACLRIDPCIAYWAGGNTNIPNGMTVYGDVYCNGTLTIGGSVDGDVFTDSPTASQTGQVYPTEKVKVTFPNIFTGLFSPDYFYSGSIYQPLTLAVEDCNNVPSFNPGSNPAGIVYRDGNLNLIGKVTINGTLVVKGNVTITGPGTVTITPLKNYPAMVVTGLGGITVGTSANIKAEGLIQTTTMSVNSDAGDVDITGALFVSDAVTIDPGYSGTITVTTDPMASAYMLQSGSSVPPPWSPAGGAFFKSITRK